jgi:hypothetical protein
MAESTLRHYGKHNREEVVVIGYKKSINAVLLVRVNALTMDDQMDLRRIASSEVAQKMDYLIPLLQKEPHRSGQDWFSYLCKHHAFKTIMNSLPIKEITDMNPEQLAFFKGYGRSIEGNDVPQVVQSYQPVPAIAAPAAAPAGDPSLAAILATLVEGQNRMAASLEKLATKVKAPKAKKAKAAKASAAA